MTYDISLKIDIDDSVHEKIKEELKALERHIDRLLDLDSWPEITAVYDVKVRENS